MGILELGTLKWQLWQVLHVVVFFKRRNNVSCGISFIQPHILEKTSFINTNKMRNIRSGLGHLCHFLLLRHKHIRCPINSKDCIFYLPREGGNVTSTIKFTVPCALY